MKLEIKRKTRNLEKLQKKLKNLGKQKVESGYFPQQGLHPTAEMTYANLMAIHEVGFTTGTGGDVPSRPVRALTLNSLNYSNKPIMLGLKNYFSGKTELTRSLDSMGRFITEYAVSLFGNLMALESNADSWIAIKGRNEPLVYDGYLKNAWSWSTTQDSTIKNLGG